MINEMKYNDRSDIWALGCLVYELCALAPPFDATNHMSLAVKINAGKFNRIPPKYSEDLHRTIRWMLNLEAAKRPSIEELERLPRIRAGSAHSNLIVKEYTLNATYAARARELKAKEEELARREAAVLAAERGLKEREAAVAARAAELQRRETAVLKAEEESRRYSMGDRLRPPVAPGAAAAAAGGHSAGGPMLMRAHSLPDVLAGMQQGGMQQQGGAAGAAGAGGPMSMGAGGASAGPMDAAGLRRMRSMSGGMLGLAAVGAGCGPASGGVTPVGSLDSNTSGAFPITTQNAYVAQQMDMLSGTAVGVAASASSSCLDAGAMNVEGEASPAVDAGLASASSAVPLQMQQQPLLSRRPSGLQQGMLLPTARTASAGGMMMQTENAAPMGQLLPGKVQMQQQGQGQVQGMPSMLMQQAVAGAGMGMMGRGM